MDLISVIVPIYKVERYLDRCVQSIVDQTYENLEIILVDDGSPDNCPAMCDAWVRKDSRIKVIHKENGGLSDARNAGMAAASGMLIGFVDSDDWITPDMYQLLYENMQENDSDIAVCGVELVYEDETASSKLTRSGECVMSAAEAMQAILDETWLKQPVWNKLYRRTLIKDILFPVGKCHEDVFWSYQAVGNARRVSVFDTSCYFYFQRTESIMGENFSLKRLDSLDAKQRRIQYVANMFPELLFAAKHSLWFSCIYTLQMLQKMEDTSVRKEGTKMVREILRANPIDLRGAGNMKKTHYVWLTMARISPTGTSMIRNMLHIGL